MAGDVKKNQTIIVRRIKRARHAPHGGAWKIAYADFVTAMMAFFLLMWLLGSTTDGDKKGIQDYFTSPLKVAMLQSGSGSGDASHILRGGGEDVTRTTGQVARGDPPQSHTLMPRPERDRAREREDMDRLTDLKKRIEERIASSALLSRLKNQLRIDLTPDGLRIQIVDAEQRPMFDSGSAALQPYMRELLREFSMILADVPNRLTIEGHTDSRLYASGERGYSNWELSADRANASRRELVSGGLPDQRILRVLGLASSLPFEKDDPQAASNRRISIIVMSRVAEQRTLGLFDETVSSGEALVEGLRTNPKSR